MVKSPTPSFIRAAKLPPIWPRILARLVADGGLGNTHSESNVQSNIPNDLQNSVQGDGSDERVALRVGPFKDDIILCLHHFFPRYICDVGLNAL